MKEKPREREKQENNLKSLVKKIKMLSQVIIEADDDTNCSYYRMESAKETRKQSKTYACFHYDMRLKSRGTERKVGGNTRLNLQKTKLIENA